MFSINIVDGSVFLQDLNRMIKKTSRLRLACHAQKCTLDTISKKQSTHYIIGTYKVETNSSDFSLIFDVECSTKLPESGKVLIRIYETKMYIEVDIKKKYIFQCENTKEHTLSKSFFVNITLQVHFKHLYSYFKPCRKDKFIFFLKTDKRMCIRTSSKTWGNLTYPQLTFAYPCSVFLDALKHALQETEFGNMYLNPQVLVIEVNNKRFLVQH